MKKHILLLIVLNFSLASWAQVSTNPSPIQVSQSVVITLDTNSGATDCNGFNNPNKVYMHSGIGDDSDPWGFNVIGNWGQDDGIGEMSNNGDGTWSITITPETYYGLNATQTSNATKIGMVFRNETGSQELKATGCSDFFLNVGAFQVTMINPDTDNGTITVNSGSGTQILAQNTNGTANYELKANGTVITSSSTAFFSYFFPNITENQYCELKVTQNGSSITKYFTILVNSTQMQAIPSGMENGINYTSNTSATLVLEAPNKDFVYVAGSFNNWSPDVTYAMKKDTATDKFWLELTGLTSGQIETYQYWVVDQTPISNSPLMVKTADPFSTLVLSPFDDPYIPASTYPSLPAYPAGQEREVTVLQTGQTDYPWVVNNFEKPKKEDLVIYEVLIRDFDSDRNFQDLIDKIDYFKNLNINAIQLMPVMEFEGNESWGYNTSFHLALDKFYGTEETFKEFIDLCHQNGIAVILDVALNHAFGRNPMNRMWMNDADNDGWGEPSSENPYFNTVAAHSYSVGSDFNHQSSLTQYYVERVISRWIQDFKIDGFRWDLTKGFTQLATGSETLTNAYQADRVAILKQYADYSWNLDPTHYVIFEHLGFGGSAQEETEWANYRLNEGVSKGIMLWGKMTDSYNQLSMGYASGSDISGMGHVSRNFDAPRLVGYAESHDEERLMYKNLQFGNQSNGSHNVTQLQTALSRMSAIGAVSLTIPGPKMIWHFGELGMENSIFTCSNGSVNNPDCKLDTKPQPQWTNNWLADANRNQIYNDWSRINALKINEPVFEGDYIINSGSLTPRISIYTGNETTPGTELKNVIIVANFDVSSQNINPSFPYSGTWYDLMDPTGMTAITVTNTSSPISIAAGQFKIYGNQLAQTLSTDNIVLNTETMLFPNPAQTHFTINKDLNQIKIFDISGKLVFDQQGLLTQGMLFDISELPKGLYLVKLTHNSGANSTTKLVKL